MNQKRIARLLPSVLGVLSVVQANAAECFVSDRTFPSCAQASDTSMGSCHNFNVVSGSAGFLDRTCDPATKYVEATKIVGNESAFVSGVTSAGALISNCTVVVSSPVVGASQHHKTSSGGCAAAVQWRIRVFD